MACSPKSRHFRLLTLTVATTPLRSAATRAKVGITTSVERVASVAVATESTLERIEYSCPERELQPLMAPVKAFCGKREEALQHDGHFDHSE